MTKQSLLDRLVDESVYILREVAAQFERPVILYSVGKDSSVLLHLAKRAFAPGPVPFPLLHVDTGYKFKEMYETRDRITKEYGLELIVHKNESPAALTASPWSLGTQRCCGLLKTQSLVEGLSEGRFDAAIGGARRDEEWSRAKERIFSFRDTFGQWDPRRQRPELWNIYNGRLNPGESIRVFPLSNWTELDIWRYIEREELPIVPLYFAKEREVVVRNNMLFLVDEHVNLLPHEKVETVWCRYRSLGCTPCTGAIRSRAQTVSEIVEEMSEIQTSERSLRVIDHDEDGSMESKKKMGYF